MRWWLRRVTPFFPLVFSCSPLALFDWVRKREPMDCLPRGLSEACHTSLHLILGNTFQFRLHVIRWSSNSLRSSNSLAQNSQPS